MDEMLPAGNRAVGQQLALSGLVLVAGLAIAGFSLARIHAQNEVQMAQATGTPGQPLQATPSTTPESGKPAESTPGGTRPTTPAPEPATPGTQAQKEGVKPVLPPAGREDGAADSREKIASSAEARSPGRRQGDNPRNGAPPRCRF